MLYSNNVINKNGVIMIKKTSLALLMLTLAGCASQVEGGYGDRGGAKVGGKVYYSESQTPNKATASTQQSQPQKKVVAKKTNDAYYD